MGLRGTIAAFLHVLHHINRRLCVLDLPTMGVAQVPDELFL